MGITQTLLLFSSSLKPVVYTDFTTTNSLTLDPRLYSYSTTSLRTITDATGALTYAPNNLLLNTGRGDGALGVGGIPPTSNGYVSIASGPKGTVQANSFTFAASGDTRIRVSIGSQPPGNYIVFGYFSTSLSGPWTQQFVRYTQSSAGLVFYDWIAGTVGVYGQTVYVTATCISAVTYETTPRPGDQVITTSAAYYGPAFDFDPITHAPLGLRVEGAGTNLALQSNTFSSTWTNAFLTLTSAATTSPDGTVNAWSLVSTNSSSYSSLVQSVAASVPASTAYTVSVFVKNLNGAVFQLFLQDNTNVGNAAIYAFNTATSVGVATSNGTVTAQSSGAIPVGNGWYRIWISGSCNAPVTFSIRLNPGATPNSVYAYGAQGELGAFPTSYIPTTTATTTRAADVVRLNGAALAALQRSANTAIMEFSGEQYQYARLLSGASVTTSISLNTPSQAACYDGTHLIAVNIGSGNVSPGLGRIGLAASINTTCFLCGNGGAPAAGLFTERYASGACLGATGVGTYTGGGYIRKLAVYSKALPARTLQQKTVVGSQLP